MGTIEVERLRDQLERAFSGNAWHGPPVFEVLGQISAGQAFARPVESAHTIVEIVLHIEAWLSIALQRASGIPSGAIADEMDWPTPMERSEDSWKMAQTGLRNSYLELVSMIGKLDDADLERTVAGKLRSYSVYEDLHGAIQHSLYHLGQIVILAKAAT